jgi:hypothetical protein
MKNGIMRKGQIKGKNIMKSKDNKIKTEGIRK